MKKSSTKSKKFMKYGIFLIFESKNNIWKTFQKRKKKLLATLNHLISRVFFCLGLNFFNFLTGCDTQCSKNLNKVQLLGEVVLHGLSQKALLTMKGFFKNLFQKDWGIPCNHLYTYLLLHYFSTLRAPCIVG